MTVTSTATALALALLAASCANRVTYRLLLGPPELKPHYDFSVTRQITYTTKDAGSQKLDIFKPSRPGLKPAVILIHGGGWYRGRRSDMESVARRLASRGFVVANISYRLAPKNLYPKAVQDTCAAIAWVKHHAEELNVDKTKMATFGYSAGAHLALLVAYASDQPKFRPKSVAAEDCRVQAVVAGAAPSNLTDFDSNKSMTLFFGKEPEAGKDDYAAASPLQYVTKESPPTFLYHGRNDWVVPVEQSRQLVAKLKEMSVPYHYLELKFGHIYNFLRDRTAVQDSIQFLRAVFAEPQE